MLSTTKRWLIALAAASFAATCSHAADVTGDATDAESTDHRPGYHTDNVRIRPTLSISESFDDNVFATDTGERSDWITVVSPQLKIDSTWDRHSLRFDTGARFGRYGHYDAENYLDFWATLEGRYALSDTTDVFGGVGVTHDHEGRDSPDASIAGSEPTTYQTRSAHAGVKTTLGAATLRFGGTYEALDYNNVGAGAVTLFNDDRDRELLGFGVRASFALSEAHELFAQALYDRRDYELSRDQNGFQRDSDGYRTALGIKSDFGGGNKTEAYVGTIRQSYDDARFDTYTAADFGGRVTLFPAKPLKLTGQLERALNETTDRGSPGYLSTALTGRLEFRATPRLTSHLALGYTLSDYLESGREDEIYSAELGVKYFVARNAFVSTGVRHIERHSNDVGLLNASNDFDKNTVFLSFTSYGYPVLEPQISQFDVDAEAGFGLLWVDNASTRFGRYNGLTDDGMYWNGEFTMHGTDSERGHADIRALDLGLDSRSLAIDWGSQGHYDAFIDYRQIPFNDFRGYTVFRGVGGDNLTLPAGWVDAADTTAFTQLANSLTEVEIGTLRKRLGTGSSFYSNDGNWTLELGYQTETKDGLDQMAGVIGTAAGNARSAMLPVPIDYTTNTLRAALGYASDAGILNLAYEGSFFYNNFDALSWQSPFSATGPLGAEGSTSLPPDNQFHQLSVSGARTLFGTTRLTAMASIGAMLQDDAFQPDTVNATLTPHALPRDSLEGEVMLYNALLSLTSRPLRGLNLKASYRLQKRDNETPQDTFDYFVADSFGVLTSSPATATNQPYSYDKRTATLAAGYRLHRRARLSGEISRETMERDPSEVSKTTEDKGELKLRLNATDEIQVALRGGVASRRGSSYQTIAGENPMLRKYNISDRDRTSAGVDISYQPGNRLTLGASLDLSDDDYDDTEVGLTAAQRIGVTLDAAYQMDEDLSAHAFVGRETYESRQRGSQVPNTPDWFVDNDDTVDSFGVGMRWRPNHRLDLSADYVISDSTGETRIRSDNALPPVSPFPDLKSRLHALSLEANYQVERNTRLRLNYRYEKFDADDWSTDGVQVNSIPEVLLLGEDNPSYSQHVIGVAVISRF